MKKKNDAKSVGKVSFRMKKRTFSSPEASYQLIGSKYALFHEFLCMFHDFTILPYVNAYGKKYKVVGFVKQPKKLQSICDIRPSTIISFDPSSEIEEVPVSIILYCKETFYFPPMLKHVYGDCGSNLSGPDIICDRNNKFVSVIRKKGIINHFPLELLCQHNKKQRLYFRETVRIIGFMSFYNNMVIRSVVFPPSVEIIDNCSFFYCKRLVSISFKGNSKLRKIGKQAFFQTSIVSIDFPASLEEIEFQAFNNCIRLKKINFPEDSEQKPVSIEGRSKLKKIGDKAFGSSCIFSISFPSSLEEIGNEAFFHCMNLREINFPEDSKLTTLKKSCFWHTGIRILTIPSSVTFIGDYVFYNCINLSSVSLKNCMKLTKIAKGAFSFCSKLSTVEMPPNIQIIEDEVFDNCKGIDSFSFETLPKLREIGSNAFRGTSLSTIIFPEKSKIKFIRKGCFEMTVVERIHIPSNIVEIEDRSFNMCSRLSSVTFGANSLLKSIGQCSFKKTKIESIQIPSSVESIGKWAFDSCENLKNVTFAEGSKLKEIGDYCFALTNIELIHFPPSLQVIRPKALFKCEKLKLVSFPKELETFIIDNNNIFEGTTNVEITYN